MGSSYWPNFKTFEPSKLRAQWEAFRAWLGLPSSRAADRAAAAALRKKTRTADPYVLYLTRAVRPPPQPKDKEHLYGIMLYHHNRLIKPYCARPPGAFSVQRSAFSVQRSAFSVQRSAFSVQL
jgi:hypothetical protein